MIQKLLTHPYLGKGFKRLKPDDLSILDTWVRNTLSMDGHELHVSAVRIFLDKLDKPKRWTLIVELASSLATVVTNTEKSE